MSNFKVGQIVLCIDGYGGYCNGLIGTTNKGTICVGETGLELLKSKQIVKPLFKSQLYV